MPKPKNAKPITKTYVDIPGDLDYFPMCFDEEYVIRDAGGSVRGKFVQKLYMSKQDKFKMIWPKGVEPNWFERKNNLVTFTSFFTFVFAHKKTARQKCQIFARDERHLILCPRASKHPFTASFLGSGLTICLFCSINGSTWARNSSFLTIRNAGSI